MSNGLTFQVGYTLSKSLDTRSFDPAFTTVSSGASNRPAALRLKSTIAEATTRSPTSTALTSFRLTGCMSCPSDAGGSSAAE